jgi:hypothetical protein
MRKTGVALALAPEPVTTVAGLGLVAASYISKGREPASATTLRDETLSQLSELAALTRELKSLTL